MRYLLQTPPLDVIFHCRWKVAIRVNLGEVFAVDPPAGRGKDRWSVGFRYFWGQIWPSNNQL